MDETERNPEPPPTEPPSPPETFDPDIEYNGAGPDEGANGADASESRPETEPEPLERNSKAWEEGAQPFDPADTAVTYGRSEPRRPRVPKVEVPKPRLPKVEVPKPKMPKVQMPRPRMPKVSVPRPVPRRRPSPTSGYPPVPPSGGVRPPGSEAVPLPRGGTDRVAGRPRVKWQPRRSDSLVAPTAKAAAAIAFVTAVALAVGSLIGLPLPGQTREGNANLAGTVAPIGEGTAPTLSDGPFHPIRVQLVNYGEFAAKFGGGRSHEGQDMFAGVGTPLVAVRAGKVVDTSVDHGKYAGGRGNYIYIYSPQDDRSYGYFHMKDPPALRIGDKVAAGQQVGRLGCTGSCYGPHLHFEVRIGKASFGADTKPIDPLQLLKRWPPVPGAQRGDGAPHSPPYREESSQDRRPEGPLP